MKFGCWSGLADQYFLVFRFYKMIGNWLISFCPPDLNSVESKLPSLSVFHFWYHSRYLRFILSEFPWVDLLVYEKFSRQFPYTIISAIFFLYKRTSREHVMLSVTVLLKFFKKITCIFKKNDIE